MGGLGIWLVIMLFLNMHLILKRNFGYHFNGRFGTSCLVTLYLLQYLGVVHAVAFLVAIPVTLPELLRASGIIDVNLSWIFDIWPRSST